MNLLPVILGIITTLTVLFFIFRPEKVLSVYILTRPIIQPFIFLKYKILGVQYSYIWAAILPVVFAVHVFRGQWKLICHKSTPLFMVLALSVLSFVTTIDMRASIDGVIRIMIGFLAFSIGYNVVKSTKIADDIISSIVYASIVPMLFGFYQVITGNYGQIWVSVTERVNSVFGIGNAYGIFLSICMCAVMILLLRRDISNRSRIVYLGLLAGMVVSQVLALNRGTWIALTAGILFALLMYRRQVKVRWFVIGASLVAIVFSGVILNRLTETTYRWDGEVANTLSYRIETWKALIPYIQNKPILGHGVGTTGVVGDTRPPHNDYIRLAMDVGIPASVTYLYFLVSLALYYLLSAKDVHLGLSRYNFAMAVLTVYFLIISTTQNVMHSFINFGFFLILNGAVIKLNVLARRAAMARAGPLPRR